MTDLVTDNGGAGVSRSRSSIVTDLLNETTEMGHHDGYIHAAFVDAYGPQAERQGLRGGRTPAEFVDYLLAVRGIRPGRKIKLAELQTLLACVQSYYDAGWDEGVEDFERERDFADA